MMEEIQKSIKLINIFDSIFDKNNNEGIRNKEISMLQNKPQESIDNNKIPFEELLRVYFAEGNENVKEICVVYRPFVMDEDSFVMMVEEHRRNQEIVEMKCFGRILTRRGEEILKFHEKMFYDSAAINGDDITVLCKGGFRLFPMTISEDGFDVKKISKTFALMEAIEFTNLNPNEFYKKSTKMSQFIGLFNNFTNSLISEILCCEGGKERNLVVKRILKLAKEFARIGAMNSLKSCIAALESNSIYRLNLLEEQTAKYRKRFRDLSEITSPEGNFEVLRRKGSLIPWLGLLMRDFEFIKEKSGENEKNLCVNMRLASCLLKLMNSTKSSRDSCSDFIETATLKEKSDVAVMKMWLSTESSFQYSTEESQYQRSLKIYN